MNHISSLLINLTLLTLLTLPSTQAFATVAPESEHSVRKLNLQSGVYQQTLDHSRGSSASKFAQRFWMDSEFASDVGAPVLLQICGEAACDKFFFFSDAIIEHAKALGARIVMLEHRYFGESQPYADLTTEHLQYLTIDNAIEDLAEFQKWLSQKEAWQGKWIALGGSYAGFLAAVYRQRHPELVVGALASSAPMRALDVIETDSFQPFDHGSGLLSVRLQDYPDTQMGFRQFTYLSCQELGYWLSFAGMLERPSDQLCKTVFGIERKVDLDNFNAKFYQLFVSGSENKASHILFTNSATDEWSLLGIYAGENHNSEINLKWFDDGVHHGDLNAPSAADTPEIAEARTLFETLAKEWLAP